MSSLKKIWLISLAVKILIATLLPLGPDEAYYWLWSHHVQCGYFDHPAMVSWLFWLGHFLEPLGHAVRLPAVLMGHATLLVWFLVLKKFYDLEKIKLWLWLALSSPIIGFGSLIVTPDIPVVFFWSLAVYFFLNGLEDRSWKSYILLGASLGLGFCSKYVIVIFVPVVLAYLTLERKWRYIDPVKLLGTIIAGLLFCAPVLIWNFQNDFISIRFQWTHGLESPEYEFRWTWNYVLAQILLIFPLVFFRSLKPRLQGLSKFFYYAGWGPVLFFFLTSFRALVEANWPLTGYPALFAVAAAHPKAKQTTKITSIFWFVLYLAVFTSLMIPGFFLNDRLREPFRYDQLAPLAFEYEPLFTDTHQMASSIWYINKKPIYKLRSMGRYDFFDTQEGSLPKTDVFYLVQKDYSTPPDWVVQQGWKIKELKRIEPHFVLLEVRKP